MEQEIQFEQQLRFSPTVILVDAAYLDGVGTDIAAHFSPIIGRELAKADLAVLLECIALDAGMTLGENDVQVIFVHDSDCDRMEFCTPSAFGKELHGMAFKSKLGEFALYAFQPSGFATREELFAEAFRLAGVSKEVKRIIAVADEKKYSAELREVTGKQLTLLAMNPPEGEVKYSFEMLGFAVLQSLGIRADEL